VAWIVGDAATIFNTQDGGVNWLEYTSTGTAFKSQYSSVVLYDVHFLDPLNGWIASSFGLLRTSDAGVTWEWRTSPYLNIFTITSVYFASTLSGWAAGLNGNIARTRDGGISWERQTSCTSFNSRSIIMVAEQEGWLVGDYGTICYTTSGGRVWTREFGTAVRCGFERWLMGFYITSDALLLALQLVT
jgi:photosystem II stability/assembly factor-like uncharacterized protein